MRKYVGVGSRKVVAVVSTVLMLLALAPLQVARAQSTGTLVGQVFDEAGQPLAGVKVTITNKDSGNSVAVQTDGTGWYRRPFLFPGSYRITASKQGFTDNGVDTSVPLSSTTEIKPPAITIHSVATAPTIQPTPPPTNQQQPAPVKETDSSLLVNKIDPMRGGNFTSLQLWTLPLGAGNTMRSFDELAFLLPGVSPPPYTPGVRGPGVGFGIGTAGQFSVNGMRARSNNFNIDGSDNNDPDVGVRRQGFVALVPQPIESVQEFQMSTLLWSAEFGRNMGSQVNAVSKAGGNSVHGQAYGFFTDSSLNARNTFNSSGREDPFTRSQAGFAIGGPVVRDRVQFFGSFEHVDVNASNTQHFSSPTLAERRFTFDKFQVLDSFSPPVFLQGGITPVGRDVLSLFPTPNNPGGPFGANTYTEVLPADGDASIASFRVTGRVTPNNTLTGRYNFTDDRRALPSVNQAIRSTIEAKTRTQNLAIVFDSGITGTLFNQGRFSYGRSRISFPEFNTSPLLLPGNQASLGPIGEIVVAPFSPVGVDTFSFPQGRENATFQFADTLSYNFRNHSLKFGADIRPIHLNSFQDRLYRPLVTFGEGLLQPFDLTSSTGSLSQADTFSVLSGVQSAALGLPASILQTITAGKPDSHIRLRSVEYNFFFNDNWRARPNFTLDYGLRYEYNTVPHEQDRRIENALALKDLPTAGGSRFDDPVSTDAFNAAVNAYKQVLAGRTGIYEPDKNNFGPHIGFAWSPSAERGVLATLFGKQNATVIRGGYGVYYDTILGAVVSQSRNVFPTEIPFNGTPSFIPFSPFFLLNPSFLRLIGTDKQGNTIVSDPLVPSGSNQFGLKPEDFVAAIGAIFRITQSGDPGGGLAFTLPQKNLRTPYAQQWHLTFDRQMSNDYLVSAAYVGTKGTKLTRLSTPNGGPTPTTFVPVIVSVDHRPLESAAVINFLTGTLNGFNGITRPFAALGAFQIFENTASSNYHALQLEARKRYSHGYQFTVAYTWSHAIDDVSDVFPIAGAPVLAQGRNSGSLATDNPANFIASERAAANYDIRQRFVASLVWDLPFYRDSYKGAARWLGGWQISSIYQAHTGQPFTINLPFDDNGDGNLSDRPVSAFGLITSRGHGSRRVFPVIQTLTDINEFFGEKRIINQVRIPRNTFRGDNFRNLDLAVSKRFRFNENQSLDFRTEMFNSLNRANYGLPVRVLSAPGFGSSYDTVNPARIIQFAMKFSF